MLQFQFQITFQILPSISYDIYLIKKNNLFMKTVDHKRNKFKVFLNAMSRQVPTLLQRVFNFEPLNTI